MTLRSLIAVVLAAVAVGLTSCPAVENSTKASSDKATSSIEYVPLDAPAGMSQAVIVQGLPLVHTRQLLPLGPDGKLVGQGSLDQQIEQTLDNLAAVLKSSGSGLDKLVRLNIYALAPQSVTRVRELLSKRLDAAVRPTITSVLTPMPHRDALVALDAVATADGGGDAVALKRCEGVAGDANCADAAILPPGGAAYLSGQPAEGTITETPVARSMAALMKTLGQLRLEPKHVVHLKVFLRPASSAADVLREVQKFFPGQKTPPVSFVEWLATMPVEIEMIAQLPASVEAAEGVTFFTPPEVRPSNVFSKVALVRSNRQIYTSGLFAREPSRGEAQSKSTLR